jgi:gliding motility-associated-like protein
MKQAAKYFLILCAFASVSAGAYAGSITFNTTDVGCLGGNGGKAEVVMSGYPGPFSYSWSNGQTDATATGLYPGTYSVKITYGPNYADTLVSVMIREQPCPLAPERDFTPNGDGYNDEWDIGNISYYPDFTLIVYNRWGQKVHEQKKEYKPWDGTWNGAPLPDASYYYVLIPDGDEKNKGALHGTVTIVR